ncbi:hypothetical protein BaRGS_00034956 [Batillaria attramentaria]|uniref:Uncharacterized protein n=1 Tax=Batillaria attramentaria TaxID=370345 RepID=A0ABD0JG23_9CAEN
MHSGRRAGGRDISVDALETRTGLQRALRLMTSDTGRLARLIDQTKAIWCRVYPGFSERAHPRLSGQARVPGGASGSHETCAFVITRGVKWDKGR